MGKQTKGDETAQRNPKVNPQLNVESFHGAYSQAKQFPDQ